ncbi:MAG: ABC transporter ATP-binding protein [Gammaproteobacteria bacterium]
MKALSIHKLTKVYANKFPALKSIDLEVEPGDFFALLGPNGAGKTTLIGIVTSLVKKTSGQVVVFGHDIDNDFPAAKACIGLVPQEFNFHFFEKVENILVNQAGYYGIPRELAYQQAEKYLKQLDLWEKRKVQVGMLSGGMKRRLMIARALVNEPKLLILDEPTAGVDIELRRSTWDFLREINARGITIILTTHYLEEAEHLCKKIAIINHGNIIENTDMTSLLRKLNVETFVLYLKEATADNVVLPDYPTRYIDPYTLEVDVRDTQSMNELLAQLSKNKIEVLRLRNKANRLEELFMRLIMTEQSHE